MRGQPVGLIRMQLPWMRTLKVGHVITNGGPYRVVRDLSRYNNGDLSYVYLSIRRCSWTHRCYTLLSYTDLRMFGYRRVRVKPRRLNQPIDRKINEAMRQPGCHRGALVLTCCDVEGLP